MGQMMKQTGARRISEAGKSKRGRGVQTNKTQGRLFYIHKWRQKSWLLNQIYINVFRDIIIWNKLSSSFTYWVN